VSILVESLSGPVWVDEGSVTASLPSAPREPSVPRGVR
jgi:hypothetical protein